MLLALWQHIPSDKWLGSSKRACGTKAFTPQAGHGDSIKISWALTAGGVGADHPRCCRAPRRRWAPDPGRGGRWPVLPAAARPPPGGGGAGADRPPVAGRGGG
jgi:hypothetical protein